MLSTEGRVVMVNGANRGIGRAVAERLYGAGYALSLGAREPGALAAVIDDWDQDRVATGRYDAEDPQTAQSTGNVPSSYLDGLSPGALRGKRIGVVEELLLVDPEDSEVVAVMGRATAELAAAGAELVRVRFSNLDALLNVEPTGFFVLARDRDGE